MFTGIRTGIPNTAQRLGDLRSALIQSLYGNDEQGAFYDPSDLSTLYQDSAGTTPVAADGDPVGLMLDLSGNGNHASQDTTSLKPLYRTDGTLHWLEFDGFDDALQTTSTNFGATDEALVGCGLRRTGADTDNGAVVELGSNSNVGEGRFALFAPVSSEIGSSGFYFLRSRGSSSNTLRVDPNFVIYEAPVDHVVFMRAKISTNLLSARINGQDEYSSTGSQGTGNYSNEPIYIGSRNASTNPYGGRLYGLILRGVVAATSGSVEQWLASKSGVEL